MKIPVMKIALVAVVGAGAVFTARLLGSGPAMPERITVTVRPDGPEVVWAGEVEGRNRDTLRYRFDLVDASGEEVEQSIAWRVDPAFGPAAILRQTDTEVDVVRLGPGSVILVGEAVAPAALAETTPAPGAPEETSAVRGAPAETMEAAGAPAETMTARAVSDGATAAPAWTGPLPATNEPENFVMLVEKDFSDGSLDSGGWDVRLTHPHSRLTLERGETPVGSDFFARFTYLAGYSDGEGAAKMMSPDLGVDELYVRAWLRWDPRWVGHRSGVNKIFYIVDRYPGGVTRPWYVLAEGPGDGPLRIGMMGQGDKTVTARLGPNLGGGGLLRGEWVQVEAHWVFRKQDGGFRIWLDGRLVAQHQGRSTLTPASDGRVDALEFHPILGGRGDELLQDQTLDVAYLYLSGPAGERR